MVFESSMTINQCVVVIVLCSIEYCWQINRTWNDCLWYSGETNIMDITVLFIWFIHRIFDRQEYGKKKRKKKLFGKIWFCGLYS